MELFKNPNPKKYKKNLCGKKSEKVKNLLKKIIN